MIVGEARNAVHITPKQKAKGRRLSISPKGSVSLRNKLSKVGHEIVAESKSPSTPPLDIPANELINGEQCEAIPESQPEGKDVTARINELKRQALSTDVSLKSWIADHKTSIDSHKSVEEGKVEVEEGEDDLPPPPLDDISAQPVLLTKPVVPVLLTPHALAIADRLGIPKSALRLAIPSAISFLETLLGNIDNVICLALSRSQPAILAKLIRPLELMLGKRVTPEHLSQIHCLWPEAYTMEPCRVIHDGKRIQSLRFHLPHIPTHDQLLERRVQFRWHSTQFIDRASSKTLAVPWD